jgi:group I intron endonuclease
MALVYKITNKINNKSYIGHTVRTLEQRWKAHKSSMRQGSNFRFHLAIRKYGIDNWNLEVLFEHDDVTICKKKEEELIKLYDLMNNKKGYNAKPGGCGGWIVPDEKYETWKQKISNTSTGLTNGNSIKYTNEDLINIGKRICNNLGRIVGQKTMVKECEKIGIRFPKSFRHIRFEGNYKNYIAILEKELSMTFNPYFRSEEQRQIYREKYTGSIGPNKDTKVIIDSTGKRKHVKN